MIFALAIGAGAAATEIRVLDERFDPADPLPAPGGAPDVELTEFLSWDVRDQHGGTCHIHAAADLFEAACFKATGEHVKLSHGYLTYRHLRRVSERAPAEVAARDSLDGKGRLSVEGGLSQASLQELLRGTGCTEEEAPSATFYDDLDKLIEQYDSDANPIRAKNALVSGLWGAGITGGAIGVAQLILRKRGTPRNALCPSMMRRLAATLIPAAGVGGWNAYQAYGNDPTHSGKADDEFQRKFLGRLDDVARKRFLAAPDDKIGAGLIRRTRDPALKKCLEAGLKMSMPLGTHAEMVKLLDARTPFICSDHFWFGPEPDDGGLHSTIVIGYRRKPDAPGGYEYLVRNADNGPPVWVRMPPSGCEELLVLSR